MSVKGVQVNCPYDEGILNKPRFEAVNMYKTDIIFSEHDTSSIADRIGLPIFIRRCRTRDSRWVDDYWECVFASENPYANQDAAALHLEALCRFCDNDVMRLLALKGAIEDPELRVPLNKDTVLEMIDSKAFLDMLAWVDEITTEEEEEQ